MKGGSALVVFSGGQDSTTCLYWTLNRFERVDVVTFDYGQRHKIELEAAKKISELANVRQIILRDSTLTTLGGNSLTEDLPIESLGTSSGLPNTFVPGRNILFLVLAAAYAYKLGISDIVTGVCQTDYSGYPDCRRDTIDSIERTLELGMEKKFIIHTPLMWLTKAQTVTLADKEGAMEALAFSHTCYEGVYPPCQRCPACILRAKGFEEAGFNDPILLRPEVP
jgi:7-cyano-7-deazaguanine synthase